MIQPNEYYKSPREIEDASNDLWAIILAIVAAPVVGFLCGLAISSFGELGSASLWAFGALAGYVARKTLARPSRLVGWIFVASCTAAFVLAEVCWIHWNTDQGSVSWQAAFSLLPNFVQQYRIAALAGGIFSAFGAWSAYRQVVQD